MAFSVKQTQVQLKNRTCEQYRREQRTDVNYVRLYMRYIRQIKTSNKMKLHQFHNFSFILFALFIYLLLILSYCFSIHSCSNSSTLFLSASLFRSPANLFCSSLTSLISLISFSLFSFIAISLFAEMHTQKNIFSRQQDETFMST